MKHTITIDIGTDVVDIPTMHSMSPADYATYIEDSLLWVDHHDVLRVVHGDYSVAATAEQVEILINHLKTVADGMRRAGV